MKKLICMIFGHADPVWRNNRTPAWEATKSQRFCPRCDEAFGKERDITEMERVMLKLTHDRMPEIIKRWTSVDNYLSGLGKKQVIAGERIIVPVRYNHD